MAHDRGRKRPKAHLLGGVDVVRGQPLQGALHILDEGLGAGDAKLLAAQHAQHADGLHAVLALVELCHGNCVGTVCLGTGGKPAVAVEGMLPQVLRPPGGLRRVNCKM